SQTPPLPTLDSHRHGLSAPANRRLPCPISPSCSCCLQCCSSAASSSTPCCFQQQASLFRFFRLLRQPFSFCSQPAMCSVSCGSGCVRSPNSCHQVRPRLRRGLSCC